MKTLKETIDAQLQEFEKFHYKFGRNSYYEEIKQWHTKSIQEVIDKVVEWANEKKRPALKWEEELYRAQDDGYNIALEDLKQQLLDIKE